MIALALFVAGAYYAGAEVGLALKLPEATPSVMWPPNAILTSVLLLTRTAWWPIVILSALPPHVALESRVGWPAPLVFALFASNCAEALIAAGGLRWLSDAPTRFDSLRRVAVFVCVAVIAAPTLTTFPDAAAVAGLGRESFWSVWRSRLFSNALTELTVVPAFVILGTSGLAWLRTSSRGQRIEAALLAASMLVAAVFLLRPPSPDEVTTAAAEAARVTWFLPLLVWAVLRLGPGGTSGALLATALLLVGAAVRTHGPFSALAPSDATRALQLFLIPISVPLLGAAALVEERRQTEVALRASESMKTDILESLTRGVVVLDRGGRIIAVNDSWRRMAVLIAPGAPAIVGENYIEFYRILGHSGERWAAEAAKGIEAVALGTQRDFSIEHTALAPGRDCTIAIRAVPLNRADGGAVVTHTDISDSKAAELEAQRARAEIAHVTRVSTVGALTASIAHQLNQPLTGILSNAQAAARLLWGDPPDVDEARASLADIVQDSRRASEVIVRMRELLRHDDGSAAEVEINTLAGDVARLLSSDAIMRNVTLVLHLDPRAAIVRGDRVQLQQVVLNLIVNAFDAVADGATRDKRVVLRSGIGADDVEVAVVDRGPGFKGCEDRAFDAFFTTKPGGMGLGLSIAKSIVQAHHGVVRAADNPGGGATVSFRLPLARRDV